MSVIVAFILVLWAWGRLGEFELRTGHARWSKIDFSLSVYFDVDRCPLIGRNVEICCRRGRELGGLHNRYYQLLVKGLFNSDF